MKADFKISSKDIINEYKSASSKSAVGKNLGISYSKVIKTLLSAGIDIEDELADNIFDLKCQGFTNQEICKQLNISMKVLNAHTPYAKGAYGLPDDEIFEKALYYRQWKNKNKNN